MIKKAKISHVRVSLMTSFALALQAAVQAILLRWPMELMPVLFTNLLKNFEKSKETVRLVICTPYSM
jgi:hypothetical protein